jgi:hypothetical protein
VIYITPPVPNQEPSWRLRADYPEGSPRHPSTFNISEAIAKVLVDKGVPVVLLGGEPVGATETALVEALDEIDRRNLRINKRALKEISYAIDLLGEGSRLLLPQIYWDCQRASEAVEEAKSRYAILHAELMRYAATQLGLLDGTILVEGPHRCVKSPTRSCLYNHDEDGYHDECLVCGDPEERK